MVMMIGAIYGSSRAVMRRLRVFVSSCLRWCDGAMIQHRARWPLAAGVLS
jgi:hypothetical protein